ncbi:MAG: hypothetical protein U5K79_22175 [Cyclobacteriaceae bacterium]|nr:hypothetical protein [Cyclobacteriaceae bacterium]
MKIQKKFYTTLIIAALLSFGTQLNALAQAPEPPIPIELLTGTNSLYFQMVVKKKFTPESRFGFFSVATYTVTWEDHSDIDLTLPAQIDYTFFKGFGVLAGGRINNFIGFDPMAGLQHNYASRKILAVTVASYFLNGNNDVELFGLYEYKPPLNEKWSLYSRLQFIYAQGLNEQQHNRSYLYLRAGAKINQFAFGLGANLDRYGENKIFKDNYGPFVKWDF